MRFVGETVTRGEESAIPVEELKILIRGRILDVSRWALKHPGGASVLRCFTDRDAAEQFAAMHSPAAMRQLDAMLRHASVPAPSSTFSANDEYWKLRDEFERDGMFKVPVAFEVFRFATNMFFYISGFLLMRFTSWTW